MKRKSWVACTFVCTLLLGTLLVLVFRGNSFDQRFNTGVLVDTDSVEHVFKICNPSLRSLTIEKAAPSCGCTVVDTLPESVAPLGVLSIPVQMSLLGKDGKFESKVLVHFKNHEPASLTIVGVRRQSLPSRVTLGKIRHGDPGKAYVLPAEAHVSPGLVLRDALLEVSVDRTEVPGRSVIRFGIVEDAPTGEFQKKLTLSKLEGLRERTIEVSGFVKGSIETSVDSISIGYISKTTDWDKPVGFVDFRVRTGQNLVIDLETSNLPEYFVARLEPNSKQAHRVNVYLDKLPVRPGIYTDHASFQVSLDGKATKVTLPIFGYFLNNAYNTGM